MVLILQGVEEGTQEACSAVMDKDGDERLDERDIARQPVL